MTAAVMHIRLTGWFVPLKLICVGCVPRSEMYSIGRLHRL